MWWHDCFKDKKGYSLTKLWFQHQDETLMLKYSTIVYIKQDENTSSRLIVIKKTILKVQSNKG